MTTTVVTASIAGTTPGYSDISSDSIDMANDENSKNARKRPPPTGLSDSDTVEEDDNDNEFIGVNRKKHKRKSKETCYATIACVQQDILKFSPIKFNAWLLTTCGEKVEVVPDNKNRVLKISGTELAISNLFKKDSFQEIPIQVSRFIPEVSIKGIAHGIDQSISDEDFKDFTVLGHSKIKEAKRIQGKLVGRTHSVIFTFSGKVLPERVYLGFLSFRIKQFVPRPLRCYKCQRFGHVSGVCRGARRCPTCGKDHNFDECGEKEMKCVNCGEAHSAADKGCRVFIKTQEVLKVKVSGKMTYSEAVKSYENASKVLYSPIGKQSSPPLNREAMVSSSPDSREISPSSIEQTNAEKQKESSITFNLGSIDPIKLTVLFIKMAMLMENMSFKGCGIRVKTKQIVEMVNKSLDLQIKEEEVNNLLSP